MQLSDIRRLLDAFERSDWNEIRLSVDGVEVFISADDQAEAPPPSAAPAPAAAAAMPTAQTGASAATPAANAAPAAALPPGAAVTSPSPGIFWRSPAPGAPPFVDVGQHVEAGTAVCIVEVMKLMNRVIAGVSGRVVAVLVENGAKVERGQPLVIVDPDPPPAA